MEKSMELQLLPAEVQELAVQVPETKQNEVKKVLNQVFNGTNEWEAQVDAIEVKDINDTMSIQLADTARSNAKKARLAAEKVFDSKRDEVKQRMSSDKLEDSLWLKSKQIMQLKFKAIEEKAKYKADYIKRHEAEQKELRTQTRLNECLKYNPEITRIEIENVSDEMFSIYISGLKKAHEDKVAAEKKAEEERIEAERIQKLHEERTELALPYLKFWSEYEKTLKFGTVSEVDFQSFMERNKAKEKEYNDKIEAQAKENERLKKEAEEKERLRKIEDQKRKEKEQAEAKKRLDAEAKRKAKEAADKRALETKLEAERVAKENAEREIQKAKQKEIDKKKAAKKAEQDALKAPDKIKLQNLSEQLKNIQMPALNSEDGKEIINSIQILINKTCDYINKKSNEL